MRVYVLPERLPLSAFVSRAVGRAAPCVTGWVSAMVDAEFQGPVWVGSVWSGRRKGIVDALRTRFTRWGAVLARRRGPRTVLNRSFGVASARTDGFREDSGLADALVDDVMHVAVDPESEPIVAEEGVEIRREVEVEGVAPKLGGMQRELGAWWVTATFVSLACWAHLGARSAQCRSTLSPVVKISLRWRMAPVKSVPTRPRNTWAAAVRVGPSSARSVQSVAPMKRTPSIRSAPGSRRWIPASRHSLASRALVSSISVP